MTTGCLWLTLGLLGAGCTFKGSMRPTVSLKVDVPVPRTLQAEGYPSADGNPDTERYQHLLISLRWARPFLLVFPDGYEVLSDRVTAEVLQQHLGPLVRDEKGSLRSEWSHVKGAERAWVICFVDPEGKGYQLSIYACQYRLPGWLRAPDGSRTYGVPMSRTEILACFGGPVVVQRGFVLLGYECD